MATLSDLSGHSIVNHFDEYLTGYPLPEIGAYAFAKTWYAPEMSRPGCVWTHTLLIPFARLGHAASLHTFLGLFDRPLQNHYSPFRLPQSLTSIEDGADCWPSSNTALEGIGEVLIKLYESPERPVLVPICSPTLVERSFIDIWSQQWPRLRRAFTFCTGAISARHMDGRWFDLQGIPEKRANEIIRSIEKAVVAKREPPKSRLRAGNWYELATNDIFNTTSPFREFLFEFGAEAGGGRRDFIGMANLFLALHHDVVDPTNSLLRALEAVFPDSRAGVKFKEKLLHGEVGRHQVGAADFTLRLLLEAKEDLFAVDRVQIREVAQRAMERNASSVLATIENVYVKRGKPSTVILSEVADALRAEDVELSKTFRNALLLLASRRPVLLAQDAFRGEPGRDEVLLDYLKTSNIQQKNAHVIIEQWLKERNLQMLLLGAQNTPALVIPSVLDILNSPSKKLERTLSVHEFVQFCELGPKQIEEWLLKNVRDLDKEEASLWVICNVVIATEIGSISINSRNVADWEYLLSNRNELNCELRKTLLVKLFCRAMNLRSRGGARIAIATFPHLYRLLMNGEFSFKEWYDLQEESMGVRWDWNECRRFAEGLIDQFKNHRWPKKYFSVMLTEHKDLASDLMDTRFFKAKYRKFIAECLGLNL